MPLAARLGIMNTSYGAGDEKKLVEQVITRPGPTLISWQHGGIPAIAKAFRRRGRSRHRAGRATGSTSFGPSPGPPTGGGSLRCPSTRCPEIRTPSSRTDRRLALSQSLLGGAHEELVDRDPAIA